MPATRLGQARGRETILECRITAYPHAVNYWQKDGRRIVSSSKHRIEAYQDGGSEHRLTLSLRIVGIDVDDYGRYDCVAANALGTDRQTIHLFGTRAAAAAFVPTPRNSNAFSLQLAICRPSGCTVVSGVVVVVVVGGGVCNRSQMRTSKCTCLIFGVSIGLDPG